MTDTDVRNWLDDRFNANGGLLWIILMGGFAWLVGDAYNWRIGSFVFVLLLVIFELGCRLSLAASDRDAQRDTAEFYRQALVKRKQ